MKPSVIYMLMACGSLLHASLSSEESQSLSSPDQIPEGLAKSDWHSIRAAYEAGRHAFHAVDGGWQARNPGQQWTTLFDGRGFQAKPREGEWTWGLELVSYGLGERQQATTGKPRVLADGQRLSYQWDGNLQEWFINDQRGLEHGFTVTNRPESAADAPSVTLDFMIGIRGNLRPTITADAKGVSFHDEQGNVVLNYTGLKVWDADGTILTSHFEAAGGNQVRLLVDERGARYPLTIDPIAQQAYLKASQVTGNDRFGSSVAVSGDTVVVGAFGEDSSTTGVNSTPNELATEAGAAYVFVRSGTTWTQQAYLKASQVTAGDHFGISVAVSGNTVVVGAYAEDSSTTGVNSTPNELASGSGAAYVFVRSGTTWTQQAYLKASQVTATDYFGCSVAVSGDTVVVGAMSEDSSATGVNSTPNELAERAGAAYVFVRSGTAWSQQAYLKASNTGVDDQFGYLVAVSGDTVVVGANYEDSSTTGVNSTPNELASDSGAAYVFVRSGTTWTQQAYLKASQVNSNDNFGNLVGVSEDTVVVGAPSEDSSTSGINGTPNEAASGSGAAYVFVRSGTTWIQQAYLKASQVNSRDNFGNSVGVSGDTVVVGAPYEDSSTSGVNGTPDEAASASGAAYIFTGFGPPPSVTSVSPATGIFSGGTSVTITGTNFTEVSSVAFGGIPATSYTVNSPTSITATTPAGSAGTVNVTVTSSLGTGTGVGMFTYLAPDIALEAPSGTAVNNGTGTLAFGAANLSVAKDLTLTLSNTGQVDLNGISLALGGTDASQFSIINAPASTLAANASLQFTLRFTPITAGAKAATLSIASNDPDENPFTLSLTGTGNGAPTDIKLSSSSVAENVPANTSISTLSSTDPDSSNTFTYTLVSGTGSADNDSFSISGETLKIGVTPSLETKSTYSIRIRSTDQGGLFFEKAFIITVNQAQSLTSWASAAGLTGPNAQPLATPFGDGVPNLLKYAFNMDGTRADVSVLQTGKTSGLPLIMRSVIGGQVVLRFEFMRRIDSSLIYVPEISSGLSSFAPSAATPTVTTVNSEWERVVIEQPAPNVGSSFGRVRVSLP